jgi:DEAD/DEAH box helicase domain-containing protein
MTMSSDSTDLDAIVTQPFVSRHRDHIAGRKGKTVGIQRLGLAPRVRTYLIDTFPRGIYQHQGAAMETILQGADVCLSTGTASGKTLAFHMSALSLLEVDPKASILVL